MKRLMVFVGVCLFLLVGAAPAVARTGMGSGFSAGLRIDNNTTKSELDDSATFFKREWSSSWADQSESQKLTEMDVSLNVQSAVAEAVIPLLKNWMELSIGAGIMKVGAEFSGAKLENNSVYSSGGSTSTNQWNTLNSSLGDGTDANGHIFTLGFKMFLYKPSESSSVSVSANGRRWQATNTDITLLSESSSYDGGSYWSQYNRLTQITGITGRELNFGLHYRSEVTEKVAVSFGGTYTQNKYELKGNTKYSSNSSSDGPVNSRTGFDLKTSAQGFGVVAGVDWEMSPNIVLNVNANLVGPQTGLGASITRRF